MTASHTYVIAEAGVNHNGSLELGYRLIDAAADAGVDAVKFQTFKADRLVTRAAPKADYQVRTSGDAESQYEMIRRLELDDDAHQALIDHCALRGITFLSTPFDRESLDLLVHRFGMRTIKLSSGDLTNAPFLLEVSRVAEQVILSSGMGSLGDIEAALGVLAFGLTEPANSTPSRAAFASSLWSDAGLAAVRSRVTLLHCTTEYPAPIHEVNLRAMDTMAAAFGIRCGYSDHTQGIHVPIAAVARGATLIEKHFTLDRTMPGPDHQASLEPGELAAMMYAIRDIEQALGDGIKRPTPSEFKNRDIARKSLVSGRAVDAGGPLVLGCKRPGSGITPFEFWRYEGRPARRPYAADELIDE